MDFMTVHFLVLKRGVERHNSLNGSSRTIQVCTCRSRQEQLKAGSFLWVVHGWKWLEQTEGLMVVSRH